VLVERLALEQRARERFEIGAMRGEQPIGVAVTLLDDAPHLGVDQLGGRLACRAAAGRPAAVPCPTPSRS
jgi:hypothetical protein